MDVLIGRDRYERRPENPNRESLMNHNLHSNSNYRENEIRRFAENGQLPCEVSVDNILDHLPGEINHRITQKMNGLFYNVNMQIHRAVSKAINEQVLPQFQASFRSLKEGVEVRKYCAKSEF